MKSKEKTKNSVESCSVCGMCKSSCPVYSVEKNEVISPRGFSVLIKENKQDLLFYKCSLCGACTEDCPSSVDVESEVRNHREKMVQNKMTTPAVLKMVENVKKYGNPYGKVEPGKIPKELYCC